MGEFSKQNYFMRIIGLFFICFV